MNPQAPEREELPARDRRWVEALRAHAPDAPPPALDASVLAAARAAVGPTVSAGRGGRPPRWLAAVAGVMVVLSAGVLVRQVAQETAPKPEPQLPAAPGGSAAERAAAAMQATREAEGLPTSERVEAAPADSAVPVPEAESSAKAAAADSVERAVRPQAFEAAAARAAPPPPSESQAMESLPSIPEATPEATPLSAPAPAAPPAPLGDVTLSGSRIRSASTEAAAPAMDLTEPRMQAKSAPAPAPRAEAGLAATPAVGAAAVLPEPELLAEVRQRLAAGDRDAARELLREWRQRHPAVELPAELTALLADADE
ncbi:MAG: hypothetical protein MUE46_13910 [Xanthomonadales bacterium]|jgi:hypothetical protein|nr:hypothetical protein [Xanthomonadales bacterium]